MRFIGWLLGALFLILLGWIGGPVAMASYRVATAAEPLVVRSAIANALVDADARPMEGGFRVNLTIVPDYSMVRECGYDPDRLMNDDTIPYLLSPDWGFGVLRRRSFADDQMVVRELRASYLEENHTLPTLAALTECLDSPVAPLCRNVVNQMIAAADAAQSNEIAEMQEFFRKQNRAMICTFLDGAAA